MKKTFCLLLVCLLSLGIWTASIAQGEAVDYSEHEEFTCWLFPTPNEYYASYSDNPVMKYLNEKFNVTLTFEQPVAGTESDALSLMFGTGQYTDLIDMTYYTGSIQQLYDDGIIIDVAEYLEYMPNLSCLMEENELLRKHATSDDGRILKLPVTALEPEIIWGSLIYRHDILETMTGGNVAFPSGNERPTTVEDWDYMLPLMKAYFEAAGMPQYAVLMLPYYGYISYGELCTGFGFSGGDYYVENGVVSHGLLDAGLYDYLAKMNEWYEAGYIYSDFAGRVNDMFFLPNTELTYGGAAGAWFGLNGQLGDAMSMPEYGLEMDLRAAPTPIMEGVDPSELLKRNPPPHEGSNLGSVVSASCHNIPKLLSIIDYMYSDEGGMLWKYGLTKEQIPASDTVYADNGLSEGTYWFEGDTFVLNPQLDPVGGPVTLTEMIGQRLPGLSRNLHDRDYMYELWQEADYVWSMYDEVAGKEKLPGSLSYPADEERQIVDARVTITDYANSMIPRFIMGTEPLNEDSFAKFVQQLKDYGLESCVEIQQAAYDRYVAR